MHHVERKIKREMSAEQWKIHSHLRLKRAAEIVIVDDGKQVIITLKHSFLKSPSREDYNLAPLL